MHKKAQMMSIFKYIFVLIVGALFIIFFIRFALNYQSTSGIIEKQRFINSFEDILSALGASSNADIEYTFGEETGLLVAEGEIHSGTASKKTDKVIYSPEDIKGTSIRIWSWRWSYPYPIDNFYYMINDKTNFLIFPSEEYKAYAEMLTDPDQALPKNFNTLVVNTEEDFNKIRSAITQNTKLILVGQDPALETRIRKLSKNVIIIKPESEEEPEYGYVEFADTELPYLGRQMLFGAIYGSQESYAFNLQKAKEKLSMITEIYIQKSDYLNGKKTVCAYNLFKTNLASYKELADEPESTPESFVQLYTSIKNTNEDLGRGCPSVF